MRVYRVRDNGEIYLPHKDRQNRFVLGDPKHGREKHHAKNKVFSDSLEEVVKMIETRGFSLWMKGQESNQTNLISPSEIRIER